ncbi:O-antigen ligase family protein [Flavobacterium sp.]|uniref:O-antigen ligase family protein n=1 Tax=Flavobacterium sp. TaxID=239 RepID=UPI00286AA7F0|nr:O-antigen ligase family protein [Flavobacterium sp.]
MKAKIIEKAYFIFLLLLPFVHFYFVIDPVLIPRQLYLSIFLLVVVLLLYFPKNQRFIPYKNPLYIAIASFLLLSMVSTYGNFTSESHYVLSKQLVIFSFLIVTIHALYNQLIDSNLLIKACIGIGIIAALGAYYHLIKKTIDGEAIFRRAGLIKSFFANKNLLSSILFLCFPFFLMGLLQSKKIKIISIIAIVSAFPMLLLLGTRAVLLAVVVFALVVGCSYLKIKYNIRKRVFGIGSIVLVLLSVVIYTHFIIPKTQEISDSKKNTAELYFSRITSHKTLISRTKFWDNSISMWKENPVLGVGLGNWQVNFPKYGLNQFEEFTITNGIDTLQRPHNDFLTILCENGVLGLMAYCFIFGIIYYQLLYLIRNTKSVQRWNFIYILAGISGYLVISFFDFPMERIEHQILLMLFFAITTSSYYLQKELKSEPKMGANILMYCAAAASFYSLIVSGFRLKGEMETVKMYAAKANQQWDETLYYANKASSYFYTIDPTSIPIDWFKGMASFNRNEMDQSMAYFESAYQKAPYQIQVINNLGVCYEYLGDKEKAKEYYLKALAISNTFEEARLNLAATYYNEKQYDLAFDVIDKIEITCHNPKYKKYLIPILAKKINIILVKNNDLELSRKIAEKITKSNHIYNLYYTAKQNNISFEAEVLSFKHKELKV